MVIFNKYNNRVFFYCTLLQHFDTRTRNMTAPRHIVR